MLKANKDKKSSKKSKCKKKTPVSIKNKEGRRKNVIYEAILESNNDNKVYIGLTENE